MPCCQPVGFPFASGKWLVVRRCQLERLHVSVAASSNAQGQVLTEQNAVRRIVVNRIQLSDDDAGFGMTCEPAEPPKCLRVAGWDEQLELHLIFRVRPRAQGDSGRGWPPLRP